jgi:serine protease Do
VFPDSPSARAGLKVADVVTEFDGERVRSLQQFTRLVRESAPDRSAHLKYQRDGRSSDISITPTAGSSDSRLTNRLREPLQALRVPPLPGFNFDFGSGRLSRGAQLGVTVQELTPDLAAYFGAKDGVLVSSVVADSPASRAGIKVGDVIASSNGRTVFEASDLTRDLNAMSAGGELTLVIVRDKKDMTVKATVDAQTEWRLNPVLPGRPSQPLRRRISIRQT